MDKKKKRASSLNELQMKITSFADYIIKETIGKGTFSKVKLGINKITGEKVAIKILDKSKILEKEDLDRIIREISILSKMDHENVIKIYQIYEDSKNYLIIMEYCEGGELFNYIVKKGRLSEKEASFFYYQLINGLEYIFSQGIAHRDLKPENLLLTKYNIIKIIDFGLSNYFDGEHNLVTPCGSPCYASPEMISGNDYNGFNIDIWATGIILFAMTCGYLPFEDPDNDKLFEKILKAELDFPEYVGDLSKDLIKKIIVTDPKKRITLKDIKKHNFYLKGKEIYNKMFNINKSKNINKNNFKKHNSDNYLTNINIKNINNKYETNDNYSKAEVKTLNNNFEEKNKIFNNIKDKIQNLKQNKLDYSEDSSNKGKNIISNRVGKYKLNGFKLGKGFFNFIKNEKSNKGLITEANINENNNFKIKYKTNNNTIRNSSGNNKKQKLFLKNKININKLTTIKKFPLKFNITELTNNYINTKLFSRIKSSKKNNNNIILIDSMNIKNNPLIIDNALINININSNKYFIDNNFNNNKEKKGNNKKIKSQSPNILKFHNYKMKDYPSIKNGDNNIKAIFSNRLRLKTDYNNYNNIFEPNLKTVQNHLFNQYSIKSKLNNKLKFNKINSFLH